MWTPNTDSLMHILVVGALAYISLLVILRLFGARSLAKFNAFDFAVTVAIGSILATSVVSKDLTWVGAVLAMGMLLLLQFLMAIAIRVSPRFRKLVTADPILIVRRGEMLSDAMKSARVGEFDVLQAARAGGHGDLSEIGAMVLETDGTISIVDAGKLGSEQTLKVLPAWK
ncbi:DUF421 domain-containing protein [Corynebacterium sp. TAE3-ERU12]|uniref:DUF421 domain-containing protein n=1 Tax=Corynebacterium sp. TAE3-ERU12 TaxID=2849491 RepID=UPI001C437D88|nr:YetF domain-containing protein [Corynebacterium sp. TAE3-ERU12]MBV7295603.1 DUF421 domain-containing protein [Corynebacterium sp. TAE3-ERU12]